MRKWCHPHSVCYMGFINSACPVVSVIQKHLWVAEWKVLDLVAYRQKLSPRGYMEQMTLQSSKMVLVMGNRAFEGLVNHPISWERVGRIA